MREEWLDALNHEIRELKQLTLETRRLVISAEQTAKAAEQTAKAAEQTAKAAGQTAEAAQQQANDSRFLLEKHIEWHEKPIWKRWFGLR